MTSNARNELIDALHAVLERERNVLIAGRLDQLNALTDKKEGLINALGGARMAEQDELRGLQRRIERNQVLLQSAMDGIRFVSARIAELNDIRQGLEIYQRDGRRDRFPIRGNGKLEKRA